MGTDITVTQWAVPPTPPISSAVATNSGANGI